MLAQAKLWRSDMLGIIPAAGAGSRIQPLAFSKELLPVGGRLDGTIERPRAISEYLVERMRIAGAEKLCFVIGAGKSDILEYYGNLDGVSVLFTVQPHPAGLCDAIFRAAPIVSDVESVAIGLPATIHGSTAVAVAAPLSTCTAVVQVGVAAAGFAVLVRRT